jgi:RHS repeat-associated protein
VTDWAGRFTQFSWDNAGRLERINRANGTWRQMVYDGAGRVTRCEEHLANGRLVSVQQYGFDAASRMVNKFTAPKMHPASFATFGGTYDADNRLVGFSHDTDGNMLAMPGVPEANAVPNAATMSATWDVRNRLTALSGPAGYRPAFAATYAYDAEGNRISKTVGGQTTSWTINPHGGGGLSQVLVETAPGGAKKFFVYGPTGLLYDVDSAATPNVRHYHSDQVGSTVALTDQAGAVIGRAEYSVYGMVSYREGDTATPFLYNGAYGVMTDAESGLLNMRARYYHPWIGRFASPDPIGFSGGQNWYAYADGNPVMYVDPSGNFGIAGALLGGAVGGIASGSVAYLTGGDIKAAIIGGAIGGALIGSGAGIIAVAVQGGTVTTAGAFVAGGFVGAASGVVGNTAEQIAQGRSLAAISTHEQVAAGAAGAVGGLAGSGATVLNQFARNSATSMNATLQANLNSYSGMLIAEGASATTVGRVQTAIVGGMAKTGYSAARVTAAVSTTEKVVFPFAEEVLEQRMKSWGASSFSFGSASGSGRK